MNHVETESGGKCVGGLWVAGGDALPATYVVFRSYICICVFGGLWVVRRAAPLERNMISRVSRL